MPFEQQAVCSEVPMNISVGTDINGKKESNKTSRFISLYDCNAKHYNRIETNELLTSTVQMNRHDGAFEILL